MTPRSITEETCSPRKSTPITIAVRGSIAPRTEVSVEPMLLMARTRARLEMSPIYSKSAAYGHFGREEPEFTWERTDKAAALKAAAGV